MIASHLLRDDIAHQRGIYCIPEQEIFFQERVS